MGLLSVNAGLKLAGTTKKKKSQKLLISSGFRIRCEDWMDGFSYAAHQTAITLLRRDCGLASILRISSLTSGCGNHSSETSAPTSHDPMLRVPSVYTGQLLVTPTFSQSWACRSNLFHKVNFTTIPNQTKKWLKLTLNQ